MPQNLLDSWRKYTVVVADTGGYGGDGGVPPPGRTTNPSLITAAAQMPQYQSIVRRRAAGRPKELATSQAMRP